MELKKEATHWFRGQLHAHSYWSDGRDFPEQVAETHRQRGYHFLCLTDHNRFGASADTWLPVEEEEGAWPPKVSRVALERYRRTMGPGRVEVRSVSGGTQVRLKTFAEVKEAYDTPGAFLLLPGVELTQVVEGRHVHVNTINLPEILPGNREAPLVQKLDASCTVASLLARNTEEALQAGRHLGKRVLLMLNHPFWRYYDIRPQELIDRPEIRLLELCSGGACADHPPYPGMEDYTVETFWDMVNAFRARAGQPLLYGTGADDAHYYDPERIGGQAGVGDSWVMVRAASLTPEALLSALGAGDFYATCGVLLDDLSFRPADRSLHVRVQAQPGVRYRIHFITTPRNFDPAIRERPVSVAEGRVRRMLPEVSPDIGRTILTVEGASAACRLPADGLYIRARVESDMPARNQRPFHPTVQTAWTQPYGAPSTSGTTP